jgi:serine/threonine-protein kinase
MSFQIGDTIGDYQIIDVLGAGGMGKVYKVKNQISDRIDALKILLPNLADDPDLADRFTREIKVLASLNHPNIAGLRTAFRQENQLLMVMEYVEGTTLEERMKAGPIPLQDAISYITQVLSALGYAHKRGVIHRDIKPANMMLTPDNVIKLMDFGIAKTKTDKKLTQTGTTMGSLFYMSAEQVQGNELDGRSDLYSVGVSLYELVTGSRPFQGKSDFDIMVAQLQQAPLPPIQMKPDLPKALNEIIMISLEKDPAKRFQTAEAFAAALGSVVPALNATPVQASGDRTLASHALAAPASTSGTQPFGSVPPVFDAPPVQAPATGSGATQAAPVPPLPLPAAGGTIPSGLPQTASPPAVPDPQPAPSRAPTLSPPAPSHGVPAPKSSKSYTGLYMTLGALIVVAILAVAAVEGTRFLKARAGGDQTAQPATTDSTHAVAPGTPAANAQTQTSAPASSPDAGQAAAAGGAGNAASPTGASGGPAAAMAAAPSSANPMTPGGNTASAQKKGPRNHVLPANLAAGGGAGQAVSAAEAGGAGQVAQAAAGNNAANAQELAELTEQHDKLSVRAQSENESVENLRRQMSASGNNLRSDISASQGRMKMYMEKSETALNAGDPVAAKKYMSLAEREVETLEKFFGH